MAPRSATTSAENRERKKFAAPVAIPICARDTAFCMQTVDTGKTVPKPEPTSNKSRSTDVVDIDTGQMANGMSARIERESPTSDIRL